MSQFVEPFARQARRVSARLALLTAVLALLPALSGAATRVTAVRVGEHPEFTRVVFELDQRAGYKVERRTGAHGPELVVTLDASASSRKLTRRGSDVPLVEVKPGEQAVVVVRLRKGDLALKEMILSKPYRVVLDVMREGKPVKVTASKPAPAPKPVAKAEPKPKPEVKPEPPKPVAKAEPKPAPQPEVKPEAKPAPKPEPPKVEPKPEPPKPVAKAEPKRAPQPEVKPEAKPAPKPEPPKVEPKPEPPKPVAKAEPKPAPQPEVKPEAKPAPKPEPPKVEPKPEPPKPVAKAEPKPAPQPEVKPEAKPAPKPEPPKVEPKPEPPKPVAKAEPKPEPKPAPPGGPQAAEKPLMTAEDLAKLVAADGVPGEKPDDKPQQAAGPNQPYDPINNPLPVPAAPEKPKPAEAKPAAPKDEPSKPAPVLKKDPKGVASGFSNPLLLAGAGGVLACALVVFLLLRRRRTLPNDLDVTAIAEEQVDAPSDSGDATASTESSTYDESSFAGLFDDNESSRPARASAKPASPAKAEPSATQGTPLDSLFDDEPHGPSVREGADDMTQQPTTDLPMDRRPAPGGAARSAAPAAGGDVMRLVQELERRMGQLESKLDQANEAREKLERQVAAQSEELRVQRAAIARTQRALRTMSRGDEEKATEPALREETQTKVRPG